MIRRILRIAVAAFCLLPLLAAAGVGWLWWEARHGRGYVAEGAWGGTFVALGTEPSDVRLGVSVLRGWPGRRFYLVESYRESRRHPFTWHAVRMRRWQWMQMVGQAGDASVQVASPTGEPIRLDLDRATIPYEAIAGPTAPVRTWSLFGVPHLALIVAGVVPPLLWAGVRWRRIRERRRRVRMGLCLACGYDLRESPEKCPECGAVAVSAPPAVRAGSARIR